MRRFVYVIAALSLLGCDAAEAGPLSPPCATVASSLRLGVSRIGPVDLLIVVDDGPSMVEEQATLARELPQLIQLLTSGLRGSGEHGSHPLRDLHVGIISADLGASATSPAVAGCSQSGDAAEFQQGGGPGCEQGQPAFISYAVPIPSVSSLLPPPDTSRAERLARDVACAAQLGSAGCAVSQPLEAALRALSPGGSQSEFLRNDPEQGVSMLGVLIITDRDDCSVRDARLFEEAARAGTARTDALCAESGDLLHGLDRFVEGLGTLRPDAGLIHVSAIAGIPTGQPTADTLDERFFGDFSKREQYFAELLADQRMQPRTRPDGTLEPVCQSELATASPAPRLVDLVRRATAVGSVHSICEPDWAGVIVPMVFWGGSEPLQPTCVRRNYPRSPAGLVPCRVSWELPIPESAPRGTPTHCSDLPYLSPQTPPAGTEVVGELCEVRQLAVQPDGDKRELEPGDGWFFAEYGESDQTQVLPGCNSIVFVPNAPPPGIKATLTCQVTTCTDPD